MDNLDFNPKLSPIVNGAPLRYSVGAYRGKKRITIAWFADEDSAIEYLVRCRLDRPNVKYDCLRSIF